MAAAAAASASILAAASSSQHAFSSLITAEESKLSSTSHGRTAAASASGAGEAATSTLRSGTGPAGARVSHARKTIVRNGELLSLPFKTSEKPFKRGELDESQRYGAMSAVLNPPKLFRKSTSAATYSAMKPDSAGCVKKQPVPYHPNAPRNRLKVEPKRVPPPFESAIEFSSGVPAVAGSGHTYRTVAKYAQKETKKPLHTRVGFTNPGIIAEYAKRAHKGLLV